MVKADSTLSNPAPELVVVDHTLSNPVQGLGKQILFYPTQLWI